jgi:hypothetical protein
MWGVYSPPRKRTEAVTLIVVVMSAPQKQKESDGAELPTLLWYRPLQALSAIIAPGASPLSQFPHF